MAKRPSAVWTGALSFGLVNVPVKMYTAVESHNVSFNQINKPTGGRVRQKLVDEGTGKAVDRSQIVKGYQIAPDRYVIVDPLELDSLLPAKTKRMEIEKFVDIREIDPLCYTASHYLAPDIGSGSAYRLLATVFEGKVGIARAIVSGKEKLFAIRVGEDGTMIAATLLWPDEIRAPSLLPTEPYEEPAPALVAQAKALVEAMQGTFDHDEYVDEYQAKVMTLINAKAAGMEPETVEDVEKPTTPAPDLMAALEASLVSVKPKAKKATRSRKKVVA